MAESESSPSINEDKAQKIVDKLVFAALREQTRARRWRIGFMLFFIGYLTVVTITLFAGSDSGYQIGGEPDGDSETATAKGRERFQSRAV